MSKSGLTCIERRKRIVPALVRINRRRIGLVPVPGSDTDALHGRSIRRLDTSRHDTGRRILTLYRAAGLHGEENQDE